MSPYLKWALFLVGGALVVLYWNSKNLSNFHNSINSKRPKVIIYTHSSFIGPWGAGLSISKEFETRCSCDIEWINAGGARLILKRMDLAQNFDVDIVIGLDQFSMLEAQKNHRWKFFEWPHHVKWHSSLPPRHQLKKTYQPFLIYDWSPMSFIYHKNIKLPLPKKLDDFKQPKYANSVLVSDPKRSSVGLQFATWWSHNEVTFEPLFKAIYKVLPSWSSAYGLFKRKKDKFIFSYITSVIYHWAVEDDKNYQVIKFKKPLPYQVELLGISNRCQQCELAKQFAYFLLEPKQQKILMEKNFMLPAIAGAGGNSFFNELPQFSLLKIKLSQQSINHIIQKWGEVF